MEGRRKRMESVAGDGLTAFGLELVELELELVLELMLGVAGATVLVVDLWVVTVRAEAGLLVAFDCCCCCCCCC
jgi:hypothetical protein